MKPLAQTLYETYCASAEWKNYRGDPCPQWSELPAAIQTHWGAVAKVATLPDGPPDPGKR